VTLRCSLYRLLRHYAAGHDRQLPSSWDEVKIYLFQSDPLTGKRFAYTAARKTCTIAVEAIPVHPIHSQHDGTKST